MDHYFCVLGPSISGGIPAVFYTVLMLYELNNSITFVLSVTVFPFVILSDCNVFIYK